MLSLAQTSSKVLRGDTVRISLRLLVCPLVSYPIIDSGGSSGRQILAGTSAIRVDARVAISSRVGTK